MLKFLHNLWCSYMHAKHYEIVKAQGDTVVIECHKCDEFWTEPRSPKAKKCRRTPRKPIPNEEDSYS